MSLEVNVIPGVIAACQSMVGGPTPGQPTVLGKLTGVFLGEQWQVAGRGPVAWVLGSSGEEDEPGGSDTEKTNHVVEVRLLYEFAQDQRHAEDVLLALLEPLRAAFRQHRKLRWAAAPGTGTPLNYPTTYITRARVGSWVWRYIVVGGAMYRMLVVNVLVGEKVPQSYQVGS